MKNFKGSYWLFLVVAVVVSYTYFFEYKAVREEEQREEEALKLFGVKKDDISQFSLKWAAGETTLQRVGEQWQLTVPVQDLAEEAAVNTVLKGIEDEMAEKTLAQESEVDLKIYGLDDPLGEVSVTLNDGTTKTIRFGQAEGLQNKKYALLRPQGKVVLLPEHTQTRFIKTAKDLRYKRLQRLSRADIVSVEINIADKGNKFTQALSKKDGQWTINGVNWDVDSLEVEKFLGRLEVLSAQEYLSEDKNSVDSRAKYKTNQKIMSFKITDKAGQSEEIILHPLQGNTGYATVDIRPTVYQIPSNLFETVKLVQTSFRNKTKPFDFVKEQVEQIDIATDLLKLQMKKENGEWTANTKIPEGKEVDGQKVTSLLDNLRTLRAETFEGKKTVKPKGTIELKNQSGEALLVLKWGDDKNHELRYAVTNKSDEALGVATAAIAALPLQTLLKDKESKESKTE